MKIRLIGAMAWLAMLAGSPLRAQQVLYSPYLYDRSNTNSLVAGKSGEYYWMRREQSLRSHRTYGHGEQPPVSSFDIYDNRLRWTNATPWSPPLEGAIKQYLVPAVDFFDEVFLVQGPESTEIRLRRYSPEGTLLSADRLVGSLPFRESAGSFLMVRSEDKNRILLLGFEPQPGSAPLIHSILFGPDWKPLSRQVYRHPFFCQPYLQDDPVSLIGAPFSSVPLQLANDGQWLMISPSRSNQNYLMFHFCASDNSFSYREIKLPADMARMEISLCLDNERQDACAGILSRLSFTSLSQVQVTQYDLHLQHFDFDSSYLFNTLSGGRLQSDQLTRETFLAVPAKGFLLLKEYGREFTDWYHNPMTGGEDWNPELLFALRSQAGSEAAFPLKREGYSRLGVLAGEGPFADEGNLNLYFFPSRPADSCWSGKITQAQQTQANAPGLSYLVIPRKERLYILYNISLNQDTKSGTSDILDCQGNQLSEGGIAFWSRRYVLSFQHAIQIEENEVAVPYSDNQRHGMAIIRF